MTSVRRIAAFFLVVVAACAADQKTVQPPPSPDQVERFLSGTNSPLLFIGKITWVQPGDLPCIDMNSRTTEWSVSQVLFGFDPGKKVGVRFGSCGTVEAQYTSPDEMLVIARPGTNGVWDGMREFVVPANEKNVSAARKAMDDHLRQEILQLIRPLRSGTDRPILVFDGTVAQLGGVPYPCPSGVPPSFPVTFEVAQVLRGAWSEKAVTVQFPGCGPRPNSQYRVGNRVIVLALPITVDPKPLFRAGLMLPPQQKDEVLADLGKVESRARQLDRAP